jgi:predicted CoA-substrate-specific enzyme activase
MGTTGYSKDLLKKVLSADVALVETVAHARSSLRLFPDVEAIIDVGGQDIKIIALENGAVKDFKLNTQCSAGNGYFLQSAAESFGISVENFADVAFQARRIPKFSYGCAVFLQSDIINFQRQGWRPEEILAGLATVLPKNVFLYVAGVSNVATLGSRFVLQGGTQKNLAVVKAEVDFIRDHYHGEGTPEVVIHPNCCEAGAIGAALEAAENGRSRAISSFPGFECLDRLSYSICRDESTRCHFCANRCLRTFVDLSDDASTDAKSKRVIIATCERGEAEDADEVRKINSAWCALRQSSPNYVQLAAEKVWLPVQHAPAASSSSRERFGWLSGRAKSKMQLRAQMRIGIPRVLNLYIYAPLFSAYFENLGIPALLALFHSGALQGGCRLLRHRSLFSIQGCSRPRLQTAPAMPEGTSRRHLLPDVRSAHVASRALCRIECMPVRLGNAGSSQGRVSPQSELVPEGGRAVSQPGPEPDRPRPLQVPNV